MSALLVQDRSIAIRDLMNASGVRFGTSGVRGPVSDMSWDLCFAYASAFLKIVVPRSATTVALGMDLRPSSPAIAAACAAAIRHAGMSVDFCGPLPTPALALYAQQQGVACIMVTGSHIPFDRNGIKFYGLDGEITKADEQTIVNAEVLLPAKSPYMPLPAVNSAAQDLYLRRYQEFFPENVLAGMRLGVYEHSGVGRDLLGELLRRLGATVVSLGRTNGFVPIDTEAMRDEDLRLAREWVVEYGLDAILSTDGDADRPLLSDEKGEWLRGDVVGILCAQYLKSQALATTVNCNTAVDDCGSFVEVLKTRIGSPYVIEAVKKLVDRGFVNVVGFEPNGGFLVGTPICHGERRLLPLMTRDAVLPMLCLLAAARDKDCRLSDLQRTLPSRFTASGRLQDFPVEVSHEILTTLAAGTPFVDGFLDGLAAPYCLDMTDGLRIYLAGDEIVHFRASGNAPELRCYAESDSRERSEELVASCLQRFAHRREAIESVLAFVNQ